MTSESLKKIVLYNGWEEYAANLIKAGCLIESIAVDELLGVTTVTYKKKRKGERHPTQKKVEYDKHIGLQTYIFAKEE